ncbi:MAG: glycosyltransferase [Arenicellales bacterium]
MSSIIEQHRLCILVNSLSGGGGETVALMLYNAFKARDIDVTLLCIEQNDMLDATDIDVHYLSAKTGSENGLWKTLSLPLFAWRLKCFLRGKNISLVQSHMYRANYVNVIARIFGSDHSLQIVNHGIASRYLNMGLLGRVNLALIKALYPRSDQLLCPSMGMMNDLVSCGVPSAKMHLVHNPFKLDDIVATSKVALPDDLLERIAGRKVIVSVGRIESVKNTRDIIEAFKGVYESDVNTCLVLVGDGSERKPLEQVVSEHGLDNSVIMTGYVANPFRYIAQATMLVSASEYEGFSNVIVEALVLGVPVVSSDCPGGPREILSAEYDGEVVIQSGEMEVGEYGLLVPVGDAKALRKAMNCLLSDEGLRASYVEKGHNRAADFRMDVIVQRHLELLQTAMAED